MRVVLTSFQGSRAILDLHYDDRHARLELDQLEDRYSGQRTKERAREEIAQLVRALTTWLQTTENQIESA